MCTAVHMIIKALCKLGNNACLLCIQHLSDALANFSFSCVFYCPELAATRDYSGQQLQLCKCNCQNDICFLQWHTWHLAIMLLYMELCQLSWWEGYPLWCALLI